MHVYSEVLNKHACLFCTFEFSELQKAQLIYFALLSSPNYKKHSKYMLLCICSSCPNCEQPCKNNIFCTVELSELQKAQ